MESFAADFQCRAFGAAEAASDRMCIATNGTIALPLSAQDTCFCASGQPGCAGGDPSDAWNYILGSGVVTGGQQTGSKAHDDPWATAGLCSRFSLPHCSHHGPRRNDPYPAEGSAGCPLVGQDNSPSCPEKCDQSSNRTFATDKFSFKGSVVTFENVAAMQASILRDGPLEVKERNGLALPLGSPCSPGAAYRWECGGQVTMAVTADFENYASGVFRDNGAVQERQGRANTVEHSLALFPPSSDGLYSHGLYSYGLQSIASLNSPRVPTLTQIFARCGV